MSVFELNTPSTIGRINIGQLQLGNIYSDQKHLIYTSLMSFLTEELFLYSKRSALVEE